MWPAPGGRGTADVDNGMSRSSGMARSYCKALALSLCNYGRHGGAGPDVGRDSEFVVFVFQF
jgi:hypothetical protein